ncbi:hypothetical protein L873DRAFT_1859594, partial [Choiromyces venosus 120613-1]
MISFCMQDNFFQQDNSPIHRQDTCTVHTASIVLDWFNINGIQLVEYPPYSPDLNPIEYVWVELKKHLQDQY